MRLIDADALKEALNPCFVGRVQVIKMIDTAPTIDATPVVYGKWEQCISVRADDYVKCSSCYGVYPHTLAYSNYCPNCGANMKGEENDG